MDQNLFAINKQSQAVHNNSKSLIVYSFKEFWKCFLFITLGILSILNHYQDVISVRSDHYLVFLQNQIKFVLTSISVIIYTFVLIRRKVRSLVGSSSLNIVLAWSTRLLSRPLYWTVVALSRVDLMGTPSVFTTIVPMTPL